jgi:hypothetical protein
MFEGHAIRYLYYANQWLCTAINCAATKFYNLSLLKCSYRCENLTICCCAVSELGQQIGMVLRFCRRDVLERAAKSSFFGDLFSIVCNEQV